MTRYHCDAFNTIFERGLLERENLPDDVECDKKWSKIRKTEVLNCEWCDLPIFTFWVALKPIDNQGMSHLRILPRSHLETPQRFSKIHRNVIPENFKHSSRDFLGPEFPDGYRTGDLVVFHCLTQHEANIHSHNAEVGDERVSMDGRFFLRLDFD